MKAAAGLTKALLAATLLAIPATAAGAPDNCYVVGKVPAERQIYASSNILMLDETVEFDTVQRQHIREQAEKLVALGNELRILTFSAFRDGRYTVPALDVRLAKPLDETARYTMRKDQVRNFDSCQQVSLTQAKRQLAAILSNYFEKSSNKLANSDIVGTLKEIGEAVVPSLRSKNRRLVLVSDMLENSALTTFYGAAGGPRTIEPSVELGKLEKQNMFSDFAGASVYVIGAGVAAATHKSPASTYRSQAVMTPLKAFWTQYFDKSNAKVAEFGQPLLLTPIGGAK